MSHLRGVALVKQCQEHLLETMRGLPECAPGGTGRCQRELGINAGFSLAGDRRDVWFVAALLGRLESLGQIEALPQVKGGKRFRLRAH